MRFVAPHRCGDPVRNRGLITVVAADALEGHKDRLLPRHTPSAPRAMAFAMSWADRIPPLALIVILSRIPSSERNLCNLGHGIFYGHGNILSRYQAQPAVHRTSVKLNNVSSRIITPHSHHVPTSVVSKPYRHKGTVFVSFIQSTCFLWSSTE